MGPHARSSRFACKINTSKSQSPLNSQYILIRFFEAEEEERTVSERVIGGLHTTEDFINYVCCGCEFLIM